MAMKILYRLACLVIITLAGCTDDNSLESKTALLVDFQWWNSGAIGTSPSGYTIVSPLFFTRNKKANIGSAQAEWSFIENGRLIKLTYPNTNYSDKWEIVNLTETEFHFKHYNGTGNFLIELKYDKCDRVSLNPC